jgi:putative restriction endonuclease
VGIVKLYVAVTDRSWFDQLSAQRPDEVNFWRPGGKTPFRALQPGAPFLFKLHSPENFIVGAGFFVKYSPLPVSVAWLAFQDKNGVRDVWEFRQRVQHYRRDTASPDPVVGCIVLTQPFFFRQDEWLPVPEDWHMNIVQGKTYDTADATGRSLWDAVEERLQGSPLDLGDIGEAPVEDGPRYGPLALQRRRLGQGAFRVLVTDAYERRCAVTGEKTLPVLEAAHIRPFSQAGPHDVANGLLIRSDLHTLFDRGYLTVDPGLTVRVSGRIREEYTNGRDYYALEGRRLISLPQQEQQLPSREFLEWHNQTVFVP